MKRFRAAIALAAMVIVMALSTADSAQASCHSPCPKPFNCLQVCGPTLK